MWDLRLNKIVNYQIVILLVISGDLDMSRLLISYTHHLGGPDGPPALLDAIGNRLNCSHII